MKTNNKLLLFVLALLMTIGFTITSCEKSEVAPSNTSVLEKRGGGGNPNNPNTPGYNPCANYVIYPAQYNQPTDWNITVDTTICGSVVIRWNAQPGFVAYTDSCSPIHGKYLVNIQPRPSSCAGSVVMTNAFYYTLGSGCSMFPGGQYSVDITWIERNTAAQKNIYHTSTTKQFSAGTRAPWLNNCN